jgi:hypothetical protein
MSLLTDIRGGRPQAFYKTIGIAGEVFDFRGAQKHLFVQVITRGGKARVYFEAKNRINPAESPSGAEEDWAFPTETSGRYLVVVQGEPISIPAEFRVLRIESWNSSEVEVNVVAFDRHH